MSSAVTTINGVVVVTHVYPTVNGTGAASPPHTLGQVIPSTLVRFRKGDPKALGTVQIMIGLMMALTGIGWGTLGLVVDSGIFIWGSTFYIIAGSLTVTADKKLNKCLVNGSLGMNIIAAITASIGTTLYSIDASGVNLSYQYCYYEGESWLCHQYMRTLKGISGVMAVLNFLELVVSIYVSSFACKAVCKDVCTPMPEPEQVFIIGNQIPQGSTMTPNVTPYHPQHYTTVGYPKGPEAVCTAVPQNNLPPQYTATIA